MSRSIAPDIALRQPIPIRVASVITEVAVSKIHQMINEAILPGSVWVKSGNSRALLAFAIPMVNFAASDGAKLSKGMRIKAMRLLEKFVKENWVRLRDEPELAEYEEGLHFESGGVVVSLGKPVSRAMAGLNKWHDAETRVVEDPDIRGGIPVMRGTRIGVYEAADALAGDGIEVALADFPSLTPRDLETAVFFAQVYPRTRRPRGCAHSDLHRLVSVETAVLPVMA